MHLSAETASNRMFHKWSLSGKYCKKTRKAETAACSRRHLAPMPEARAPRPHTHLEKATRSVGNTDGPRFPSKSPTEIIQISAKIGAGLADLDLFLPPTLKHTQADVAICRKAE